MESLLYPPPVDRAEACDDLLCVGIDVGKFGHMGAFLSSSLLSRNRRYDRCPTLQFDNSRAGFLRLLDKMQSYAPLDHCVVLVERTGHYHVPLQEALLEAGVAVYDIQVQERSKKRDKSDKQDALSLANHLYCQVVLGVQVDEPSARVHRVSQASPVAQRLRGLVHHRERLMREAVRRRNRLTAICDQLFPELCLVIKDVNCTSALLLRERYPRPSDVERADVAALKDCCPGRRPGRAQLARLQELATSSIGIKDEARIELLIYEQSQLIDELRLLEQHLAAISEKIAYQVALCREGRILTSLPMIGPYFAAALIAGIGTIANFEDAAHLRSYLGWRPRSKQTGTTEDTRALAPVGNRLMRHTMYLIVWAAIRPQAKTEWGDLYRRLVPKKCAYDARKKKYIGKNKVIGRVAGQIATLIYHLLKKDYDVLMSLSPGEEPPPPIVYDRALHQAHRRSGMVRDRDAWD